MEPDEVNASIGIVGTGFVSHHLIMTLDRHVGLTASRVLTRRRPDACNGFAALDRLTNSVDERLESELHRLFLERCLASRLVAFGFGD